MRLYKKEAEREFRLFVVYIDDIQSQCMLVKGYISSPILVSVTALFKNRVTVRDVLSKQKILSDLLTDRYCTDIMKT